MSSQSSTPTARRHASTASMPARARSLKSFLPDEIVNPTTVEELGTKIEVIMKTASNEQFAALDVLLRIVRELINRDDFGAANTAYYNKLVNQVVTGRRSWHTLTARIDEIPGICEPIAMGYDLLLCGVEMPAAMPAKPVRGWRRHIS